MDGDCPYDLEYDTGGWDGDAHYDRHGWPDPLATPGVAGTGAGLRVLAASASYRPAAAA